MEKRKLISRKAKCRVSILQKKRRHFGKATVRSISREFEAVEVDIDRPLRHERVLSIRLDEMTITKMEALARQRHIGKSTLARMLIVQGLEKFSRTG